MQRAAVSSARVATAVAQGPGRRHNSVVTGFRDFWGLTTKWVKAPNNKPQGQAYFQKDGIGNPAHPTYLKGSKDVQVQMGMSALAGTVTLLTLYGILVDMRLGKGKSAE